MSSCITTTLPGSVSTGFSTSLATNVLTITEPPSVSTSTAFVTTCASATANQTLPLVCATSTSVTVLTIPGTTRTTSSVTTSTSPFTVTVPGSVSTSCVGSPPSPAVTPSILNPTPTTPLSTPTTTPPAQATRTTIDSTAFSTVTAFSTFLVTATNSEGQLTTSLASSAYPSLAVSNTGQSKSSPPTGAIVGGVVGGILALLFLFALLEGLRRKGYICAGKHDEGLDDAVWDPANYSPSAATVGRASDPEKEELDSGHSAIPMEGAGGGMGERPQSQAWSVASSSNYGGGGGGQQDMRSLSPQNGNYDRRSMNQGMVAAYLGANMLNNRHSQSSYEGYLPPSPPHQQQEMQQSQYYRQNPIADPATLYRSPSDSHTPPDGRTPSDPFLTPTLSDGGHSGQTHATTGSSLNGHSQQNSQPPPPLPSPVRPSVSPLTGNERSISRTDSVRSVDEPAQSFGTLRIMNITEEED